MRHIGPLLIALAALTASLTGCTTTDDHDAHDHTHDDAMDNMAMDGHATDHDTYEIPEGEPRPTVAVSIEPDAKAGHNVHIIATDFTFSPETASREHIPCTGHAHLYVDGVKVGRVYSDWYYLSGLAPGEHHVKVSLNTNDHRAYSMDGRDVQDSKMITVPEPVGGMIHTHDAHEAPGPMSLSMEVTPDPMSGYNLHITAEGFTFSPQNASMAHAPGEGHAHLYVDGVKVTRLYGDWYHLGLDGGEHAVRVSLNGNDHVDYTVGGEVVAAEVTLPVEAT